MLLPLITYAGNKIDNGTLLIKDDKIVSVGSSLDMRTNILSKAFIQGRQITLEGRQQMLYQRFSEKYGH